MSAIRNKVVSFPKTQVETEVVTMKPKKKLRPWVKATAWMIVGGAIVLGGVFNINKTTYVEVEVEYGDTVCSILEEYNGNGACGSLSQEVYNSNGMFYGKSRDGLGDIKVGDVLTIPVREKRFVK